MSDTVTILLTLAGFLALFILGCIAGWSNVQSEIGDVLDKVFADDWTF